MAAPIPLVPPYIFLFSTHERLSSDRELYRDHDDLPMHIPLSSVRSSREEGLHNVQPCQPCCDPEDGPQEGNGVHPLLQDLRDHRQWHGGGRLEVTKSSSI
jgi:hypothetical protein